MKAAFYPAPPRPSLDILTLPLGRFPAGTFGKLKVLPEDATPLGTPLLEGDNLASIAAAHAIRLYVPKPPVPSVVQLWRLRAVARHTGLIASIDAAIQTLPEPAKTNVWSVWNEGQEVHRNSATTLSLGAGLGLSSEQLDELFRQAAAITV